MKTFLEVVEEIKKSFDQDDASILAAIEDSLEADLTEASIRHPAGTFFVYDKKVYKAIQLIPVGDPIVIGTAGTPGVNAVLAEDIMSLLAGIGDSKFGDFTAVTDVTIDGTVYHTYWKVAPTNSNQVSGLAIHPTTGQLCEVYNNQGTYSLTSFMTEIQALTNETNDIVNVLGAKNLLPNEGTSQTYRGITFTFLTDGSIVATGTADSNNNAELKFTDLSGREIAPRNKTYILTGCPSGGNGKYNINIAIHSRSSGVFIREIDDVGNGAEFTLGNDEVINAAFVKIGKGETVNNLVFAPMIRPASILDDTYVPYAMTNRELTQELLNKGKKIQSIISDADSLYLSFITSNNEVYRIQFTTSTSAGYKIRMLNSSWQMIWAIT